MSRRTRIALVVLALVRVPWGGRAAFADEGGLHLGGFFGARTFSAASALGNPTQTSLSNSVVFGARASWNVATWLSVEGELPLALAGTRDDTATVMFTEPRVHGLMQMRVHRNVRAFLLAGLAAPIALSSNRPRFNSDILPGLYIGTGAKLDRRRGFSLRIDLRLALTPARGDALVTPEVGVFVSVYRWGKAPATSTIGSPDSDAPANLDSDRDGVPDDVDKCVDRVEDVDGFEDADGCPDIDDDRDEVLDISDKCRLEPETWNGYRDNDGCPDAIPAEILAFAGPLRGLAFRAGSAVMTRHSHRVLDKLAAVLVKYPSVRGRVVGHADGAENGGDADANLDLSQRRAEAVMIYLIAKGVQQRRLGAVGVGAETPLADADGEGRRTRKQRALNRRAEFTIRRRDQ